MDLLLYLIIFVFSAMFWYRKKYGQRNELLEKFQAPEKSMPILRHSFMLINKTPSQILNVFSELAEKCGPVWRFDFSPFTSMITVHDPKILEQILSSQKLIDKSDGYDNISNWLGNGLLMSTGAKWHQRRKIITPTFHFKILEEFVEIMNKHGNVFVKKLKKYNGRPIDVFPLVSLYALDVICESAMGYQLNAQIDDTSEYVKAVKEMASIAFLKSFNVIKRIKFLYQFSNTCKREKVVVEKLHDFTNSVISARRKYLKQREFMADNEKNKDDNDEIGMKKKTAFLDLLLQVQVNGQSLSDEGIREEVDTFMFEAHDTTSSAIVFTLLNLAKHQEIQKKVYNECFEIFGNDLSQQPTMQDLNKMNYLDKVIKENLRLYPSVPNFGRKFNDDEVIGDYIFPKNVAIRISPYLMGRDPKLFPDPLKFDPSRFEIEKNIRLFSFVPFSAGPRNCIGQKYAMLELKSVLSKIVRNFEVCVRKENENPIYASELVLRPMNGIYLYFKDRNHS